MELLKSVVAVNEFQPKKTIEKILEAIKTLNGKKIVVLGLAFKPGTDDIRESPSIPIIKYLIKNEAKVVAHDPYATKR